jgi:hypothetical protein
VDALDVLRAQSIPESRAPRMPYQRQQQLPLGVYRLPGKSTSEHDEKLTVRVVRRTHCLPGIEAGLVFQQG